MTEQLISLETAKLAYEKGFIEYQGKKGYYRLTDGREILLWIIGKMDDEFLGYAPTQALLQKWLRDEHGIKVLIDYYCIGSDDYEWGYMIKYEEGTAKRQCERLKTIESVQFYPGGYSNEVWPENNYETALEAGLKKALTLLK